MGTLKIGSSKNKKGITIDPNTVLFNNKNVKSIKSGVTEIWSKVEALIPTMTSDTTPSGTVTASSQANNNYAPWKAFDNNDTTKWVSTNVNYTSSIWVQYKFNQSVYARKFSVKWDVNIASISYKIQASDNGTSWTDLTDNITNTSDVSMATLNNTKSYMYYRLFIVSQTMKNTAYNCGDLKAFQLYG